MRRRLPLAAIGTIAGVSVWPLRRALPGGVLFTRDIHLVWHPQVEGFVRAVMGGAWPLWDPTPGFGQPLLADPSAMVAYPPTWLNLILPGWLYYTVFALTHLAWSMLGLYLLARRWRLPVAAACMSAAAWGLSGPLLSLVALWHHYASAAWIPWTFLAAERAVLLRTRRAALAWAGATTAQILAGSADMTAMTGLAIAAYLATRYVRWRRPFSSRNRALAGTAALALALALGLSALLWIPAVEQARQSARWGLSEQMRTFWSVHPLGMLQAVVPDLWYDVPLKDELRAAMFESREPFLTSLYLGMASVALVAAAFAGRRRPRSLYLLSLTVVAGLFSLGRHGPFYSAAVAVLPALRILRYPMKAFVLVAFGWSLLCGMGLQSWAERRTSRASWKVVLAVQGALLALSAGAAAYVLWQPHRVALRLLQVQVAPAQALAPLAHALLGAATAAALACGLALWRLLRPAATWLAVAAGALAVIDLGWFNREVNEVGPRRLYARPPVVDVLRRERAQRVYVYDYAFGSGGPAHLGGASVPPLAAVPPGWSATAAVALAMQMHLMPPSAGRWGLETAYEADLRGLHPHVLTRMLLLMQRAEGTPLHTRLLRLGAVSHVVALHDAGFEDLRRVETLPGLFAPAVRVFAVPDTLPRAFAVGGARVARDQDALPVLADPAFDPAAAVVIPPTAGADSPAGRAGRVRIVERRADLVRLQAEMEREGWVVLVENYDPGWRVRVDGRPRPLVKANLMFRAVRVPAGRHEIAMRYRPAGVLIGLAVTLVAAAAGLAVLAGRARRGASPDAVVASPRVAAAGQQ